MNPLRVACCQFSPEPGDPRANVERMSSYIRQAAADAVGFVVFPELITTGYLAPERIPEVAEPLEGPTVNALGRAARDAEVAVAFGMAQRIGEREYRNSLVYLDCSGKIADVYHKMHLWDTEKGWATAGTEMPVVDIAGARLGGWICYDTRFPEAARLAAVQGAEVAAVATAWLGPSEEWELALRARALDNSMFVAGADIIDPAIGCHGCSLIADPTGRVLARAEREQPGIVAADLDPDVLVRQRSRVPLLADRVPRHYGSLG